MLGESNDNVEYVSEVQDIQSDEEEGEIKSGGGVTSGASWRYLMDDDEEEEKVKKKRVKKGAISEPIKEDRIADEENGTTSMDSTPKAKQNDEESDTPKNKRTKHDTEGSDDSKSQPGTPQPPPPPPPEQVPQPPPPPPADTNTNNNTDTNSTTSTTTETEAPKEEIVEPPKVLLRQNIVTGCRHVDNFKRLNKIEEGTYGVVYRAQDKETGEIVALKKLKMDREKEGFPITSLREIKILLTFKHPNIVDVREVAVGNNLNSIFIVMEYVDHDVKTLMEEMPKPLLPSEVKNLIKQLLEGMAHLHDNWVLHRDLKTSNLLYNNKGMLKIADFGLAREYGSPLKPYSLNIVTLWYRAPELLLGCKQYTTAVDMWSVGCIFAELISKQALLQGRTEIDQIDKIFRLLGTANEKIWPGFSQLPNAKKMSFVNQPYNNLRQKFPPQTLTESGFDLLNKFLTYDPKKRITAAEALKHPYFSENPAPKDPALMPTWPASHDGVKRKRPLDELELREQQRERELQQQSEHDRYKQAEARNRAYQPAPPPGPFVLKGTSAGFGFK